MRTPTIGRCGLSRFKINKYGLPSNSILAEFSELDNIRNHLIGLCKQVSAQPEKWLSVSGSPALHFRTGGSNCAGILIMPLICIFNIKASAALLVTTQSLWAKISHYLILRICPENVYGWILALNWDTNKKEEEDMNNISVYRTIVNNAESKEEIRKAEQALLASDLDNDTFDEMMTELSFKSRENFRSDKINLPYETDDFGVYE